MKYFSIHQLEWLLVDVMQLYMYDVSYVYKKYDY